MPHLTLNLRKTLEQNAAEYFEKAKKAKKKIEKISEIVEKTKLEYAKEHQRLEKEAIKDSVPSQAKRKPQWYEKFRWFKSSEGFLAMGGRDATTNELIIKKQAEKEDIVCHTDMAGSPFFIIKANSQNKKIGEATLQETVNATCSFSRAWGNGMITTRTFWVNPDQVSKQAQSGEFLPKGAFMIRGKTNYLPASMDLAVGLTEDYAVMCGPKQAVQKHCPLIVPILQGNQKTSDVAKKIRKILNAPDLDAVLRALPSGGCKIDQKIEKELLLKKKEGKK